MSTDPLLKGTRVMPALTPTQRRDRLFRPDGDWKVNNG